MIIQNKAIDNIIFDLGGVILDIEPQQSIESFAQMGINHFGESYAALEQHHLFERFETGLIDEDAFRNEIRRLTNIDMPDKQIDEAWNAMILDLPKLRIDILKHLKRHVRIFLMSNTNPIHERYYTRLLQRQFNINGFEDIFESVYYSHRMKRRKPDPEIFRVIINENGLAPDKTLFIDDSERNLPSAEAVGIHSVLKHADKELETYLSL